MAVKITKKKFENIKGKDLSGQGLREIPEELWVLRREHLAWYIEDMKEKFFKAEMVIDKREDEEFEINKKKGKEYTSEDFKDLKISRTRDIGNIVTKKTKKTIKKGLTSFMPTIFHYVVFFGISRKIVSEWGNQDEEYGQLLHTLKELSILCVNHSMENGNMSDNHGRFLLERVYGLIEKKETNIKISGEITESRNIMGELRKAEKREIFEAEVVEPKEIETKNG